jgi:hypothetical protein
MRGAVTTAASCAAVLLSFALVPGRASAGEARKAEPAPSADSKKKKDASAEKATAVHPGESGLVVVRDAETGELRAPQGNESAGLLRAVPANNQSDEGLVQVPNPQGGFSMDLKGRFQSYFVVTVQPDGSLKAGCVDHQPNAAHEHAIAAQPTKGEDR